MARLSGATAKPQGNQQIRNHFEWPGMRCARLKSLVGDPKPVDLCLGRLKPGESWVKDRTVVDVQITRMTWV